MKMRKNHTLIFKVFTFILFSSCSNDSSNDDSNGETIPKIYISKVTITEGPNYHHFPNSITSFVLSYDSNKKLTSIDVERTRDESGVMTTHNATYLIAYENNQIVKAYTDCATNDCEWAFISQIEGFHQISFEYDSENEFKSIMAFEQIENTSGSITYSNEISRYLLNSNNLVKRVEENTEIIYSNNNIVGIQNSSSFNDGLLYSDYDDNKSVVIFTDDTNVIDIEDYFPRLILDLKYSKNNFRKLNFDFRGQNQTIDFEYDIKSRPTKRTVFNNNELNYEEIFEYLD